MEGITVLDVQKVCSSANWPLCFMVLGLLGFVLGCALCKQGVGKMVTFWLIMGGIVTSIFGTFELIDTKYSYNEYYVTIDDSVSFTELFENYDIVSRHGSIYVIKEKQ